jgi:hypothetical protein
MSNPLFSGGFGNCESITFRDYQPWNEILNRPKNKPKRWRLREKLQHEYFKRDLRPFYDLLNT